MFDLFVFVICVRFKDIGMVSDWCDLVIVLYKLLFLFKFFNGGVVIDKG